MSKPKGKMKEKKDIAEWLLALPDEHIDLLKQHKKLLEEYIELTKGYRDTLDKNIGLLVEKHARLSDVKRRKEEVQKMYA